MLVNKKKEMKKAKTLTKINELHNLLMNEDDTISIDGAIINSKNKVKSTEKKALDL